MPHLRNFLNECGETVITVFLDYDKTVYIATLESRKFLHFHIQEESNLKNLVLQLLEMLWENASFFFGRGDYQQFIYFKKIIQNPIPNSNNNMAKLKKPFRS